MARLWRNQGQVHPDGESQVDRNGSLKKKTFLEVPVFKSLISTANGALQDCRTRDENQSLQQRGIEMCIFFSCGGLYCELLAPFVAIESHWFEKSALSLPDLCTLQGLTASARMDPAERERCDMMGWLNQCIDTLNIQVALAHIEHLHTTVSTPPRSINSRRRSRA